MYDQDIDECYKAIMEIKKKDLTKKNDKILKKRELRISFIKILVNVFVN